MVTDYNASRVERVHVWVCWIERQPQSLVYLREFEQVLSPVAWETR